MAKSELANLIVEQKISNHIYMIRGQKVMLDMDLATMYDVETKQLKKTGKTKP